MLHFQKQLSMNPVALFRLQSGLFLVRLSLVVPDGSTDRHMVAYDAGTGRLLDNEPRAKV